jgi:hypothetical protein
MRDLAELEMQFPADLLLAIVRQAPRPGTDERSNHRCCVATPGRLPVDHARPLVGWSPRFHEKVVDPCSN